MDTKIALQVTMSHINNYGSVLQAYALQHAIESIPGWRCQILDVAIAVFDGYLHCEDDKRNFLFRNIDEIKQEGVGVVFRKARGYFQKVFGPHFDYVFRQFVKETSHLTKQYQTRDQLYEDPPRAQLYITGSDQTLNPKFTHADPIWVFDFVKNNCEKYRKIAYAASIASSCLSDRYRDVYRRSLSTFDAISLRERTGVSLVSDFGINASHCADPTMLLDADYWLEFAGKSVIECPKKYILSYNPTYYVNPYPMARRIEHEIAKRLGLPIVYLDFGYMRVSSDWLRRKVPVSVYDFVRLFFGASFILTSSYHGTAFALQAKRPFITYVASDKRYDSRAADLLETCSATHHAMRIRDDQDGGICIDGYGSTAHEQECICKLREDSLTWLSSELRKGDL